MDLNTAKHLNKTMFPQPLAIICYHCQQAVEKYLKGALVLFGVEIRKTHDLGLLAEDLNNYINVDDKYIDYCYDLTTYGVKTRYPQELQIEVHHKDFNHHNNEYDNLILLCSNCHTYLHHYNVKLENHNNS
jgi:HEPN domain-containing protein